MASVLSRIQIIMEANTARYNNELRRARDHSRSTFGKISESAAKMALGVGTALAGMGALSVKTAMSFESSMAEVNKTVDFVSENGLANLKKELEDLTKTMPLAFEELASIAAAGGQSGVAGEALADFTETIAKMSIAFDISAGETADAMAKIASSYNVPIENVKELGDAINEVSNNGAVKANQIVDFMLRVGQSASNLGIAGEAAAALGGALIDAGGSVEVVGTAMKSLFTDMSNTKWIADNSDALTSLGVNMEEYAKIVRTDGLAAFMMLREGVMSAENPIEELNNLFGAAGGNIASLFSEGTKVEAMLGSVGQVAGVAATHIGSLDREYQAMADTSANAFILLKNSARLILAAAGEAFLPAVRQMTDALVPLVQKVAEWAKANPELIVTIAKVTAVALALVVAVGSVSSVVTAAVTAWTAISTVFGVAKVAILALSGPIGLTVVAVGALVAAGVALYKNWDEVKVKAAAVWAAIKETISSNLNAAKTAIVNTWNNAKSATVNKLNEIAAAIVNTLKSLPAKMLQVGRDIVNGLINGIKQGASGVATAIGSMASSAVAKAKSVLDIRSPSRVMKKVGEQTAEGMAVGIKKGTKQVVTEAQRMAQQAIQAVEDGIDSFRKRIALFGDSSELSSLLYDINAGKYKGASDARIAQLVKEATALHQLETQLTATNAVQKRFAAWEDERERMRATATKLIRGRFDQIGKDRISSSSALDGVMGDIQQETPMGKIQSDYEKRMEIVRQFEALHTDEVQRAADARLAIEQSYMDAKRNLMLTQGEALFGDLAGLTKSFAGEQSGIYRAVFAVEKIFAMAQSAMAIQVSIAKAMSVGFPANIPLIGQAVAQGAKIVSNIKSIAMPVGQAHDGIANVPREGTWVLDKNERVVKADDNKKLSRFLDNSEGSKPNVNVNVTVTMDGNSNVESNSAYGKQIGQGIAAVVVNEVNKMTRPNGTLDRLYAKR